MNIECSTASFKHAIKACAGLQHTSLTAIPASPEHPARLDICAVSSHTRNGVSASLPACVERAGQVCLSAALLADTLATFRGEQIHLSQVEVPSSPPPSSEDLITPLKKGPALQLEGRATSQHGTVSTQRIRLRLSSPERIPLALPDLASWRTSGQSLGEAMPATVRAALAPCLHLARQRAEPSETTPEMNHALVLLRCGSPLQWTATTRGSVVSTQMHTSAWDRVPITHALFDEQELTWVYRALAQIQQPVRLTLVPQEKERVALLVESGDVTLFVLGTTAAIPLVWEKRPQQATTFALTVERVALQRAIAFFSATRTGIPKRHVQISSRNGMLSVQGPIGRAGDAAERQIPVPDSAIDISPMQIHLQQMQHLLRFLKTPTICLETGTLLRQGSSGKEQIVVDWLRLSPAVDHPSMRLMLASSQFPAPLALEQKGAVLETVEGGNPGAVYHALSSGSYRS